MPVFDDAHFERRFFTRYLGGFTVFECVIVIATLLIAVAILGYWPPPIPILAMVLGVQLARWSRRINTDGRPLSMWCVDMLFYLVRLRPLRARRQVYGQSYNLPGSTKTGGVVQLPRHTSRNRRNSRGQSNPALTASVWPSHHGITRR